MNIIDLEKPDGVIVQFGGQTPLNLATRLWKSGVPIIGTTPEAIDRAEDRGQFKALLDKLGLKQPENGAASTFDEIKRIAHSIGYPVLLRPSFVLGGAAMEIVYDDKELERYFRNDRAYISKDKPLLVDRFLDGATEVDVDLISDNEDFVVGGVMEHIEQTTHGSSNNQTRFPDRYGSARLLKS